VSKRFSVPDGTAEVVATIIFVIGELAAFFRRALRDAMMLRS
jgi:hypothetical protein